VMLEIALVELNCMDLSGVSDILIVRKAER